MKTSAARAEREGQVGEAPTVSMLNAIR